MKIKNLILILISVFFAQISVKYYDICQLSVKSVQSVLPKSVVNKAYTVSIGVEYCGSDPDKASGHHDHNGHDGCCLKTSFLISRPLFALTEKNNRASYIEKIDLLLQQSNLDSLFRPPIS